MWRILSLLPLFTIISCATVLTGTRENITVSSSPAGADAILTCSPGAVDRGVTPVTFSIHRKSGNCRLTLSKEGFIEEAIAIEQGINGKYWVNFAFSPLVPAGLIAIFGFFGEPTQEDKVAGAGLLLGVAAAFTVDHFTGAINDHQPKTIAVTLKPK